MSMLIDAYRFGGGGGGGGATPTVLDVTPSTVNSNLTSHLVAMPATVAAGDLLLMLVGIASNSYTATTPSGWTLLSNYASGASGIRFFIYYKVAAGTEGGTTVDVVTSAGIRSSHQVYRIQSGTFSGTPQITTSQNPGGVDTAPNPPNLAPSWGSANTLWIIPAAIAGNPTASVYPGTDGVRTNGHSTNTMLSCRNATAGASLDPGTFTISSAFFWIAATIGIRPV